MVQKMLLYVMPIGLFVSGFLFPIGVLLYWFTNNLWTLGQQFFILRKMPPPGSPGAQAKASKDGTDADKPVVDPRTLAPRPGAKPVRPKSGRTVAPASTVDTADPTGDSTAETSAAETSAAGTSAAGTSPTGATPTGATAAGAGGQAAAARAANGQPRGGAGRGSQGPANRGKRKRR